MTETTAAVNYCRKHNKEFSTYCLACSMESETKPALREALSPVEKSRRAEREEVIRRGLATFYEVGLALTDIREERLYRDEFDTFEDYCAAVWQFSASRARQICQTAGVMVRLGQSVTIGNAFVLPANDRQVRPLLKLPANEQASAWLEALTTAQDGVVTGALVERIVLARLGRLPTPASSTPETPKTQPETKPDPATAPIANKATRLRAALDKANAAIRELVTEIGTPDSEAASDVMTIPTTIEDYRLHLQRMGKLHESRK